MKSIIYIIDVINYTILTSMNRKKISKKRYIDRKNNRYRKYDISKHDSSIVFCRCNIDSLCQCNYAGRDDSDIILNLVVNNFKDEYNLRFYGSCTVLSFYNNFNLKDYDISRYSTDMILQTDTFKNLHSYYTIYDSERQSLYRFIDLYREYDKIYYKHRDVYFYKYGGYGKYLQNIGLYKNCIIFKGSSIELELRNDIYKSRYTILQIVKHLTRSLVKIGSAVCFTERVNVNFIYNRYLELDRKIIKIVKMIRNRPKVHVYSIHIPSNTRSNDVKRCIILANYYITLEYIYNA